MANNQEQFNAFHDTINATQSRRSTLQNNRNALRDRIRNILRIIIRVRFNLNSIGKAHMLCTQF